MRGLFALTVVAAGCGIGSYNDFRDQLATRWCERQIRCGEVAGTDSLQHCTTPAPLALTERGAVDVPTALAAHRMIFHPANAAECLDAVKSAPCDPQQAADDFLRHCHGVITAGVAAGGVCWGDDECVGGVCVDPDCGGTCTPYALPGGACVPKGGTPDHDLRSERRNSARGDGVCFHKEAQGGPCAADEQCLFDFVCVAGKCDDAPRTHRDDVCGTNLPPCEDGLYCDETGVCAPLKPRPRLRASLTPASRAWPAPVALRAVARRRRACSAAASACPLDGSCQRTLCTSATGKVGPLGHCATDGDCDDGLYCATGSYCYYVGGVNAVCQSDHECAKDLQCLAGACHTPGYIMCATTM